jgi:hypothetical protein
MRIDNVLQRLENPSSAPEFLDEISNIRQYLNDFEEAAATDLVNHIRANKTNVAEYFFLTTISAEELQQLASYIDMAELKANILKSGSSEAKNEEIVNTLWLACISYSLDRELTTMASEGGRWARMKSEGKNDLVNAASALLESSSEGSMRKSKGANTQEEITTFWEQIERHRGGRGKRAKAAARVQGFGQELFTAFASRDISAGNTLSWNWDGVVISEITARLKGKKEQDIKADPEARALIKIAYQHYSIHKREYQEYDELFEVFFNLCIALYFISKRQDEGKEMTATEMQNFFEKTLAKRLDTKMIEKKRDIDTEYIHGRTAEEQADYQSRLTVGKTKEAWEDMNKAERAAAHTARWQKMREEHPMPIKTDPAETGPTKEQAVELMEINIEKTKAQFPNFSKLKEATDAEITARNQGSKKLKGEQKSKMEQGEQGEGSVPMLLDFAKSGLLQVVFNPYKDGTDYNNLMSQDAGRLDRLYKKLEKKQEDEKDPESKNLLQVKQCIVCAQYLAIGKAEDETIKADSEVFYKLAKELYRPNVGKVTTKVEEVITQWAKGVRRSSQLSRLPPPPPSESRSGRPSGPQQ